MIRNVLTHISGVEWYGMISILLFFVGFLGVLLRALRHKGADLDVMRRIPLDDAQSLNATENSQPVESHE